MFSAGTQSFCRIRTKKTWIRDLHYLWFLKENSSVSPAFIPNDTHLGRKDHLKHQEADKLSLHSCSL